MPTKKSVFSAPPDAPTQKSPQRTNASATQGPAIARQIRSPEEIELNRLRDYGNQILALNPHLSEKMKSILGSAGDVPLMVGQLGAQKESNAPHHDHIKPDTPTNVIIQNIQNGATFQNVIDNLKQCDPTLDEEELMRTGTLLDPLPMQPEKGCYGLLAVNSRSFHLSDCVISQRLLDAFKSPTSAGASRPSFMQGWYMRTDADRDDESIAQLTTNSGLIMLLQACELMQLSRHQSEHLLRKTIEKNFEGTDLADRIKTVIIDTGKLAKIEDRMRMVATPFSESRIRIQLSSVDDVPKFQAFGRSIQIALGAITVSVQWTPNVSRRVAADGWLGAQAQAIRQARDALDPDERLYQVSCSPKIEWLPGAKSRRTRGTVEAALTDALGGEQNGIVRVVVNFDKATNAPQWWHGIMILIAEVDDSRFVQTLCEQLKNPMAQQLERFSKSGIKQIKIKLDPNIIECGSQDQHLHIPSDGELITILERFLFNAGPFSIPCDTLQGSPIVWTGQNATSLPDLGPVDQCMEMDGIIFPDLRRLLPSAVSTEQLHRVLARLETRSIFSYGDMKDVHSSREFTVFVHPRRNPFRQAADRTGNISIVVAQDDHGTQQRPVDANAGVARDEGGIDPGTSASASQRRSETTRTSDGMTSMILDVPSTATALPAAVSEGAAAATNHPMQQVATSMMIDDALIAAMDDISTAAALPAANPDGTVATVSHPMPPTVASMMLDDTPATAVPATSPLNDAAAADQSTRTTPPQTSPPAGRGRGQRGPARGGLGYAGLGLLMLLCMCSPDASISLSTSPCTIGIFLPHMTKAWQSSLHSTSPFLHARRSNHSESSMTNGTNPNARILIDVGTKRSCSLRCDRLGNNSSCDLIKAKTVERDVWTDTSSNGSLMMYAERASTDVSISIPNVKNEKIDSQSDAPNCNFDGLFILSSAPKNDFCASIMTTNDTLTCNTYPMIQNVGSTVLSNNCDALPKAIGASKIEEHDAIPFDDHDHRALITICLASTSINDAPTTTMDTSIDMVHAPTSATGTTINVDYKSVGNLSEIETPTTYAGAATKSVRISPLSRTVRIVEVGAEDKTAKSVDDLNSTVAPKTSTIEAITLRMNMTNNELDWTGTVAYNLHWTGPISYNLNWMSHVPNSKLDNLRTSGIHALAQTDNYEFSLTNGIDASAVDVGNTNGNTIPFLKILGTANYEIDNLPDNAGLLPDETDTVLDDIEVTSYNTVPTITISASIGEIVMSANESDTAIRYNNTPTNNDNAWTVDMLPSTDGDTAAMTGVNDVSTYKNCVSTDYTIPSPSHNVVSTLELGSSSINMRPLPGSNDSLTDDSSPMPDNARAHTNNGAVLTDNINTSTDDSERALLIFTTDKHVSTNHNGAQISNICASSSGNCTQTIDIETSPCNTGALTEDQVAMASDINILTGVTSVSTVAMGISCSAVDLIEDISLVAVIIEEEDHDVEEAMLSLDDQHHTILLDTNVHKTINVSVPTTIKGTPDDNYDNPTIKLGASTNNFVATNNVTNVVSSTNDISICNTSSLTNCIYTSVDGDTLKSVTGVSITGDGASTDTSYSTSSAFIGDYAAPNGKRKNVIVTKYTLTDDGYALTNIAGASFDDEHASTGHKTILPAEPGLLTVNVIASSGKKGAPTNKMGVLNFSNGPSTNNSSSAEAVTAATVALPRIIVITATDSKIWINNKSELNRDGDALTREGGTLTSASGAPIVNVALMGSTALTDDNGPFNRNSISTSDHDTLTGILNDNHASINMTASLIDGVSPEANNNYDSMDVVQFPSIVLGMSVNSTVAWTIELVISTNHNTALTGKNNVVDIGPSIARRNNTPRAAIDYNNIFPSNIGASIIDMGVSTDDDGSLTDEISASSSSYIIPNSKTDALTVLLVVLTDGTIALLKVSDTTTSYSDILIDNTSSPIARLGMLANENYTSISDLEVSISHSGTSIENYATTTIVSIVSNGSYDAPNSNRGKAYDQKYTPTNSDHASTNTAQVGASTDEIIPTKNIDAVSPTNGIGPSESKNCASTRILEDLQIGTLTNDPVISTNGDSTVRKKASTSKCSTKPIDSGPSNPGTNASNGVTNVLSHENGALTDITTPSAIVISTSANAHDASSDDSNAGNTAAPKLDASTMAMLTGDTDTSMDGDLTATSNSSDVTNVRGTQNDHDQVCIGFPDTSLGTNTSIKNTNSLKIKTTVSADNADVSTNDTDASITEMQHPTCKTWHVELDMIPIDQHRRRNRSTNPSMQVSRNRARSAGLGMRNSECGVRNMQGLKSRSQHTEHGMTDSYMKHNMQQPKAWCMTFYMPTPECKTQMHYSACMTRIEQPITWHWMYRMCKPRPAARQNRNLICAVWYTKLITEPEYNGINLSFGNEEITATCSGPDSDHAQGCFTAYRRSLPTQYMCESNLPTRLKSMTQIAHHAGLTGPEFKTTYLRFGGSMQELPRDGPDATSFLSPFHFRNGIYALFWALLTFCVVQLIYSTYFWCTRGSKSPSSAVFSRRIRIRSSSIKTNHLWRHLRLILFGVCIGLADNPTLGNTTPQLIFIFASMPVPESVPSVTPKASAQNVDQLVQPAPTTFEVVHPKNSTQTHGQIPKFAKGGKDTMHGMMFPRPDETPAQHFTDNLTVWAGTRVQRWPDIDAIQSPDRRYVPCESGGMPLTSEPEVSKKEQPTRRSRRLLSRQPVSTHERPPTRRIIYVLGDLPTEDLPDWDQLLYEFHADDTLQDMADAMLKYAQHFLKWCSSAQGQGYSAAKQIPAGTRFCYYSGVITTPAAAAKSNHRVTLGTGVNGVQYLVVIDGCPIRNAVGDAGTLGLAQMGNHSCNPNCKLVPIQTHAGLEFFVLEAIRDIDENEEITMNYDACASPASKRLGLTFWRWGPKTIFRKKEGLRRITCGCAGDKTECPNKLWRDEWSAQIQQQATSGVSPKLDTQHTGLQTKTTENVQPPWPVSNAPAVSSTGSQLDISNDTDNTCNSSGEQKPDHGKAAYRRRVCSHAHSHKLESRNSGIFRFNRTLVNIGNTCFFNSMLQLLASTPLIIQAIDNMPNPSSDDDVSYCIKYLKRILPAIAAGTPEPSIPLTISSTNGTDSIINMEDWKKLILILTRKYDSKYSLGAMADPGALLDYFFQIIPEAGNMCEAHFHWSTTFLCACNRIRVRATKGCERGISITLHNDKPLIHHIVREFQPENIIDYKCEGCQSESADGNPATRQRKCLSLPRLLKITITGPQMSTGMPQDYHPYGPLIDYTTLDLSPIIPSSKQRLAQYNLCSAIMYCNLHHWCYLHGPTPTIIDDGHSRVATPADMEQVAKCARVLLYERLPPKPYSPVSTTCVPAPAGQGMQKERSSGSEGDAQMVTRDPTLKGRNKQMFGQVAQSPVFAASRDLNTDEICDDVTSENDVGTMPTSSNVFSRNTQTRAAMKPTPARGFPQNRRNTNPKIASPPSRLRGARQCVLSDFFPPQSCTHAISKPNLPTSSRQSNPIKETNHHSRPGKAAASVLAIPQRALPDDILEAEAALRSFDTALCFGPNGSCTRLDRLNRRQRLSPLTGWDWVCNILQRYPILGAMKATDRYADLRPPASCDETERIPHSPKTAQQTPPGLPDQYPETNAEPCFVAHTPCARPYPPDRQIHTRTPSPSATPWIPGSSGLYPRPIDAQRAGEIPTHFPIWHWREQGKGCQESMFRAADRIEHSHRPDPEARSPNLPLAQTMYIAADVWVPQKKTAWKLGKVFGAFRDPMSFVNQLLEISPNRCFYEIIREGRPCKAYFDMEAEPGVWDEQQGKDKCKEAIELWAKQMQYRWPEANSKCPQYLAHMILDGSRMTDAGWKVSYHVIFPWLVFPCNTTLLKHEAMTLSAHPQLQYKARNGALKSFVDPAVYTRNRQFRLLMNYKLSDKTRTALHLNSAPSLRLFCNSCITYIGPHVWHAPESISVLRDPSVPDHQQEIPAIEQEQHPLRQSPSLDLLVETFITACLIDQGYRNGKLIKLRETGLFRWEMAEDSSRPCSIVKLWRPQRPTHQHAGAQLQVDSTGHIFLTCLHETCLRTSQGNKWFLSTLPTHLRPAVALASDVNLNFSEPMSKHPLDLSILTSQTHREQISPTIKRRRANNTQEQCPTASERMQESSSAPSLQMTPLPRVSIASVNASLTDKGGRISEKSCEGNADHEQQETRNARTEACAENRDTADTIHKTTTPMCRALKSRSSSMIRVEAMNQTDEPADFQAWNVTPGPFGGRLGSHAPNAPSPTPPDSRSPEPNLADEQASLTWSELPHFSAPAPTQLMAEINTLLESANHQYVLDQKGAPTGWKGSENCPSPPITPPNVVNPLASQVRINPDSKWFNTPSSRRPRIGRRLINNALRSLCTGASVSTPLIQEQTDFWETPLVIGYLNVGFRRLSNSIQGVVNAVLQHRPDILFLGDIGVPRNKIGKLRQTLERKLGDEWFMLSNISVPHSKRRATGIAAVVHCSLAKSVTAEEIRCPEGMEQHSWIKATSGRILHLKLTRQQCPHTWHLLGIYQHVASPDKTELRSQLLSSITDIMNAAKSDQHKVLLIGDVNAAPKGGRWGYSASSKLKTIDADFDKWVNDQHCREIMSTKPRATWKAYHSTHRAILDRVFIYPANEAPSPTRINWNRTGFDHALIYIRLPKSSAGTGYAGASDPGYANQCKPRCRIDLKKWNKCRDEWHRLLTICLDGDNPDDHFVDPFIALKHGESIAEDIAYKLAPKRIPKPDENRRSFCFSGHRLLFRELNSLRAARALVSRVLQHPGPSACSINITHAAYWKALITQLPQKLKRSGLSRPPDLMDPPQSYFTPAATEILLDWAKHAKVAAEVRHATIREAYDKARFQNVKQFRRLLLRSKGTLDQTTLRAALGKRQPKQRMWGITGRAVLGVRFELDLLGPQPLLEQLRSMVSNHSIVQIIIASNELTLWFRGPRQAGDFFVEWCSEGNPLRSRTLHPLPPPAHYVATVPDDMLAIQEWHMANEGLDTRSVCQSCRAADIQPITTSATHQPCGNPTRAVRYLCSHCNMVHDEVTLPPISPCPLPLSILQAARVAPAGIPAFLSLPIDYETHEACVRNLLTGKSVGTDGILREFFKYGPRPLLERLRAAFNAYLSGKRPTVCEHEWMGAIVTLLAKQLAALQVTEFRPIASLCAKFAILNKILAKRISRFAEEHGIIEDAQEAFRRNRSTIRQLQKIICLLDAQRRQKSRSLILFLDLINAFNAMNHSAIFSILRLYGFPDDDIALMTRLYDHTFLFIGNYFGNSAACFLSRGAPQGADPSPVISNTAFNMIHVIARVCARGCTAHGLAPSGSSGYADDASIHTDGPAVTASLQYVLHPVGNYLEWLGTKVHMKKSEITGMDFATGEQIATDNIKLNGQTFQVLDATRAHKVLGVRISLTGDFTAEKRYVLENMKERVQALRIDQWLTPTLKEVAVQIGIIPFFRYSAGVVPWSKTELEYITTLWLAAYKQAWTLPRSMDSTPFTVDREHGGRECPSATEVWIRAVLDTLDQCLSLPGEIACIVTAHLQDSCLDHGCYTLNQLQRILRVNGSAETTLERFLLRLDEQGLEVSSPWPAANNICIAETIWPSIAAAWTEKQKWAGCTELSEIVQASWQHAQLCISACKKLGRARILRPQQLRNQAGWWRQRDELSQQNCQLSLPEYAAIMMELTSAPAVSAPVPPEPARFEHTLPPHTASHNVLTAYADVITPCIRGRVVAQLQDEVELEHIPLNDIPAHQTIQGVSDDTLVQYLCRSHAVLQFTMDGQQYFQIECLVPGKQLTVTSQWANSIIICIFRSEPTREATKLAVLSVSLIRDALLENGIDTLQEACNRPNWRISKHDLQDWYFSLDLSEESSLQSPAKLSYAGSMPGEQSRLIGFTSSLLRSKIRPQINRFPMLYRWQVDPPLPGNVTIDLSNHHPRSLPCPEGWEIVQRNGRTMITGPNLRTVCIDSAQYHMLCSMHKLQRDQSGNSQHPEALFLRHLYASCMAQQSADVEYHIHWSRHLLACIREITGAQLLLGARAVAYNPHFSLFASPFAGDRWLGAVLEWPSTPLLFTPDSYDPAARQHVWQRLEQHRQPIWILIQERKSPAYERDLLTMRTRGAKLCLSLGPTCKVVHKPDCWADARWDTYPTRQVTQLWLLEHQINEEASPRIFPTLFGNWDTRRYDFHFFKGTAPAFLQTYWEGQQDALRLTWNGHIGGTDGGVRWQAELMGAGYAVGTERIPSAVLAIRVGGPLSSLRAEAVALLLLLHYLLTLPVSEMAPLLVFVDNLTLLLILQKWGKLNYNPEPKDIVHFDVIEQLLKALRRWPSQVRLVKIKSHTGCLLNERSDEQVEIGYSAKDPEAFPGPQKFASLSIRARSQVRNSARECKISIPRDSAPNHKVLKGVISTNICKAARQRNTIFVRQLLCRDEGRTIARTIARCKEAEYRIWLKAMSGRYPVQTYLHRVKLVPSPHCIFCPGIPETLLHFACTCPQFREARTAAHNRVRHRLYTSLSTLLPRSWTILEETPLSQTGLHLDLVPAHCMLAAGRTLPEGHGDMINIGRLQPDMILISQKLRKIGILDLCRPMDESPSQLQAAADRKLQTYAPIKVALQKYPASGWTVEILPWVVGIRGLLKVSTFAPIFKFLIIPHSLRINLLEETAFESAKAFYFLHQTRRAAIHPQNLVTGSFSTDDAGRSCNRKRKRRSVEMYAETRKKWKQIAATMHGRC